MTDQSSGEPGSPGQPSHGSTGGKGGDGGQGGIGKHTGGEGGAGGKGGETVDTLSRLREIREAGLRLAESAAALKEVADKLRADVDALTVRVTVVENDNSTVAGNLIVADKKVQGQQIKQDGRLDNLETN